MSAVAGRASKTSPIIVTYTGGPHEMLNEINRVEALANLLGWISAVLDKQELANKNSLGVSRSEWLSKRHFDRYRIMVGS